MKKERIRRKNRITLKAIFALTVLFALMTLGMTKQDKFIYKYNFQKVKSSARISDRIEYSIKAIKHSRTEEEVRNVMELIQRDRENIAKYN